MTAGAIVQGGKRAAANVAGGIRSIAETTVQAGMGAPPKPYKGKRVRCREVDAPRSLRFVRESCLTPFCVLQITLTKTPAYPRQNHPHQKRRSPCHAHRRH